MTHFDYEEAICDNPRTSFFLTWTASDCGWISSIHLLDHLLALGADYVPVPGQFPPGNISHRSYFSPGMCIECMSGCTNQYPLHLLQRLGGVSVANTSPLGHRREGQLLVPVHLLQPGELEGSKGAFGNTSSPGSQSDTETGPCSFSRRDQLGPGCSLQIPIQVEPNYWDVSPAQRV